MSIAQNTSGPESVEAVTFPRDPDSPSTTHDLEEPLDANGVGLVNGTTNTVHRSADVTYTELERITWTIKFSWGAGRLPIPRIRSTTTHVSREATIGDLFDLLKDSQQCDDLHQWYNVSLPDDVEQVVVLSEDDQDYSSYTYYSEFETHKVLGRVMNGARLNPGGFAIFEGWREGRTHVIEIVVRELDSE